MGPQLAFHADGGYTQEGDEEVVPPMGGGKVRHWARCNKCNKKGHYTNKCSKDETKQVVSAFGIEGSDDKGYSSSNNNKFIFLTNQHMKYATNICKVNKTLTLNYFKHSTQTNYMCNVPGYGELQE
eukprot:7223083-Ditylum_brightwellii.AAC.1